MIIVKRLPSLSVSDLWCKVGEKEADKRESVVKQDGRQMMPSLQVVNHYQFWGEAVLTGDTDVNAYFCAFSVNLIVKTWLYAGIEKLKQHFYNPVASGKWLLAELFYVCMWKATYVTVTVICNWKLESWNWFPLTWPQWLRGEFQ